MQIDYSYDFPYDPYVVPPVPIGDSETKGGLGYLKWAAQTAINFSSIWG